jgi:hypothetical protein
VRASCSAGLYGPDPSLGVTEAEAGLLLPGFLGQDAFNLLAGVPLLLGSLWLARIVHHPVRGCTGHEHRRIVRSDLREPG